MTHSKKLRAKQLIEAMLKKFGGRVGIPIDLLPYVNNLESEINQ